MTLHRHCNLCGEPMPTARFGQRYCDGFCRREGQLAEAKAARRFWIEAGRPMETEVTTVEIAEPIKRRV
jgi:predicted nucleic acid-binding Zn ribbon protein